MERPNLVGLVALCGALAILGIFAIMDFYAIRQCFSLAHTGVAMTDLCSPEHIFRTSLEIGGMAIGLYGAARIMKS
ncbi:MAG TPA: hypothetical protein VFW22_07825 [Pseudolabrys sp.]|nr:hypothetical protein [Pseudolabrys sp.]